MSRAQFRSVNEQEGGQWHRYRVVSCRCGAEGRIKDTSKRPLAVSPCADAFRRLGWTNVRPDRATCPACSVTPPRPQPKPLALKEPAMPVEAPRQPSTDDKRRIRDALFDRYLEEKGCYAKAHSDRSVGQALNVPFAWVTATREALGFGPDVNEAASVFNAEVAGLRQDLLTFQDEVLKTLTVRADELEKRLNAVERAGYRSAA